MSGVLNMLHHLDGRGFDLSVIGPIDVWFEPQVRVVHLHDLCDGGGATLAAPEPVPVRDLMTMGVDDAPVRLCRRCDNNLDDLPLWRTLHPLVRACVDTISQLCHPRTSIGSSPDHGLARWLQATSLAAAIARGETILVHGVPGLDPDSPLVRETRRVTTDALDDGRTKLAELRTLMAEQRRHDPVRRYCALDGPDRPTLVDDSLDPSLRRDLWYIWWREASQGHRVYASRFGDGPASRILNRHDVDVDGLDRLNALVDRWERHLDVITEDQLTQPRHLLALRNVEVADRAAWTKTGSPVRVNEALNFALAHFDTQHYIGAGIHVMSVPPAVARVIATRYSDAWDLGEVGSIEFTETDLLLAQRIMSSSGPMSELATAMRVAQDTQLPAAS